MKKKRMKELLAKEQAAELLKERIYATLALLAVLISIDTRHYSVGHAALVICGTILSLWAASIVASVLSKRVIYQADFDKEHEREHQLRKHAPMLATLVFPMCMVGLAALHVVSLDVAINVSLGSALLLLVAWSILSARSMKAKKVPTLLLVVGEVLVGLAVVALKLVIGH